MHKFLTGFLRAAFSKVIKHSMSVSSGSFIEIIFMDKLFVQVCVVGKEKVLFGFSSPNFGTVA